ncbi:hypothetical protein HDU86_005597 [Geranomyces michiganensis]|nr:hypothetical protein HDU86_005597 [Geranomyces michiganensis]
MTEAPTPDPSAPGVPPTLSAAAPEPITATPSIGGWDADTPNIIYDIQAHIDITSDPFARFESMTWDPEEQAASTAIIEDDENRDAEWIEEMPAGNNEDTEEEQDSSSKNRQQEVVVTDHRDELSTGKVE